MLCKGLLTFFLIILQSEIEKRGTANLFEGGIRV